MNTDVYIVATVEGGITTLILATTDEQEADETFEECMQEPAAGYVQNIGDVVEEHDPAGLTRFAWNESDYEVRMWTEGIFIDARSIVHDAFMEYDPDLDDYVCPDGIAGCPCAATDRTEGNDDTEFEEDDEEDE